MSGPFRSEAPYLEERLRVLEEEAASLRELDAEITRERRLQERPSRLVFLSALVGLLGSLSGFVVGRINGQEAAKVHTHELADRAYIEAEHARIDRETCEAALGDATDKLSSCTAARTKVRDGGPEVFVSDGHAALALEASLVFFIARRAIDGCAGPTPDEVVVFATYAANGEPTDVELHTNGVSSTGRACIEKVVRDTALRPFTGEPVVVRATFTGDYVSPRVARRRSPR